MATPPTPTPPTAAKKKATNPMHVLPNQSKNPKLGDAVMIGVGNDDQGNIIFQTGTVIQVTPPRHADQAYRFKWEIPPNDLNQEKARVGWTNVNQRVPFRTVKCDARLETHASFDFVRHIDLKELTKKDVENQLYQELRDIPLVELPEGHCEYCLGCEKEILQQEIVASGTGKNNKIAELRCRCRKLHVSCEKLVQEKVAKLTIKSTKEQFQPKNDTKNTDTDKDTNTETGTGTGTGTGEEAEKIAIKYTGAVCPFCHINQPINRREEYDIVLRSAKCGDVANTLTLAVSFYLSVYKHPKEQVVELNFNMAAMLLGKVSRTRVNNGYKAHANYLLGCMVLQDSIATSCLDEKRKKCEEFWRAAVACLKDGHVKSQQQLDLHFPTQEMIELEQKEKKRKLIEYQLGIARGEIKAPVFQRGAWNGKVAGAVCPKGHVLVQFLTPQNMSHSCDECHDKLNKGNRCHGCDACDYDVCQKCYKVKDKQRKMRIKKTNKKNLKQDKKKAKALGISYQEYMARKEATAAVEAAAAIAKMDQEERKKKYPAWSCSVCKRGNDAGQGDQVGWWLLLLLLLGCCCCSVAGSKYFDADFFLAMVVSFCCGHLLLP